jgi:hypothetical protein
VFGRTLGMIALLAACTQGSGCAAGTGASDKRPAKEKPTTRPVMPVAQQQTYAAPVVVDKPVPPKPVREGTPPIVYLLPADGSLRIVDKTAGQEIATTAAEARSIVRIDDVTGVQLGKQTLRKGPLPPGHEYEIYLTTGSANEIRRSVSSPGKG